MKLKKLFALALCFALCMSCLAAFGSASAADADNGLVLNKTVTPVEGQTGTYQVKLEAYSTGTNTYAPADIVLVLDESSGMTDPTYDFIPVYGTDEQLLNATDDEGNKITEYYILQGNDYVKLEYCGDPHLASGSGLFSGDGWYTGDHFWDYFHWGNRYLPKREEGDVGDNTEWLGFLRPNPNYYPNPVLFYVKDAIDNTSKLTSLQAAAKQFVNTVNSHATTNKVAHSISVVGFKSTVATTNTEVAEKIDLTAVNTDANVTAVKNAIDALNTASTSGVDFAGALDLANTQLSNAGGNRNRVVVVFTCMESITQTQTTSAIGKAKTLKGNNATVITVGMMSAANPNLDVVQTNSNNIDLSDPEVLVNVAMQGVSSNFPAAEAYNNLGQKESSAYYLTAANEEHFNNIFSSLQSQLTTPGAPIDATAQVFDKVTEYFNAPTTVSEISVKTVDCTGYSGNKYTWENSEDNLLNYSVTVENGEVTVSNFAFDTHCVTKTAKDDGSYGKKLVIKYNITTKNGFLGGNGVPTDVNTSGVRVNSELFEKFIDPTVDIPLNYSIAGDQEVTIYNGNEIDVNTLFTLDPVGDIYNDFVTVGYTLTDQVGTVIDNPSIAPDATLDATKLFAKQKPSACNTYTLSCVVTPTKDGTYQPKSDITASSKVHVLVPTVTGTDVTIWQGNSTELAATKTWKCTCEKDAKTSDNATAGLATLSEDSMVFTVAGEQDKTQTVTEVTPPDCTQYTVYYTANGIEYTDTDYFWVHVRTVSFAMNPKTIYLTEKVDVAAANKQVKTVVWQETACDCKDMTLPEVTGSKGVTSVVFDKEGKTANIQPGDCTAPDVYLKIGDNISNVKTPFTVHVLKPSVATTNATIFLGQQASVQGNEAVVNEQVIMEGVVTDWKCQHGNEDGPNSEVEERISWDFLKKDTRDDTITDEKLKECTPTVAVGTLYGQKFTSKPVMVHVVLPTVTGTEATIKMGNPAPLAATTEWGNTTCECGDKSKPKTEPTYALSSNFYDGTAPVTADTYPNGCHIYTAKAVVDGAEYGFVYHEFTIHVQTPEVTGTDDTIYQGQDYDLASTVTWKKCSHEKPLTNENEPNPVATTTYQIKNAESNFSAAVTKANYDACSNYKVIYQLTNLLNTFTDEFTVHVLIPTFTVEAQDLWADLGTNVTLFTAATDDVDAVNAVGVESWKYAGTCSEGHSAEQPTNAPEVPVTKVEFDMGESVEIQEQDVLVTANKVSYTMYGKSYTAGSDRLAGSLTAKLHANTFILKVVNSSAQNGIFTLKQGDIELYDVAIPGNSNITRIAGLYCTLNYNLDETSENAWSWRYNNEVVTDAVTHSTPNVVSLENCNEEVTITVSYGDTQDNAKWLASEDCVVNKATTQAAITNPALSVKKKEEEVTNA